MSVKRKRELSWHRRAQIIYFHLHPDLANKRIETTSKVFAINSSTNDCFHKISHENVDTLQSWIGNKKVIPKWYPLVDKFRIAEVHGSVYYKYNESIRSWIRFLMSLRRIIGTEPFQVLLICVSITLKGAIDL